MSYEKKNEKEEERKGGAAPWMGQSAAVGSRGFIGSSTAGVRGLFGARGLFSALVHSRALLLIFAAAAAGYSTLGLLDMHDRGGFGVVSSKPGGTFFSPPMNATGSSLPRPDSRGTASSLDMAHQANQGAFNEGAPAKEGEGNGSPAASADSGQNAQAPDAAAAGADPASAMADAAKAAAGPRAGLSRVSGSFAGGGGGSGGSMSAGGAGAGGKTPGTDSSRMSSPPNAARAKLSPASRGGRFGRSGTLRRLSNMSAAIKPTSGMGDKFAASDAQTRIWEGEKPTGSGVTGAGPSSAGLGTGPSANEGMGPGGPVNTNGSSYNPNTDTNVPAVPGEKNVTPYQGLVDIAVDLLMTAALLTALATVLWLLSHFFPHLLPVAIGASKLAMVLAAGAAACGVAIMTVNGQMLQGGIFTGLGSILTVLALKSAAGDPSSMTAGAVISHAAIGMGAPILAKLGSGLGKVADKTDFGTKGLVGQAKDALKNGYDDPLGFNQQAQETGDSLTSPHDNVKKATDTMKDQIKPGGKPSSGGGAGGGGGGGF